MKRLGSFLIALALLSPLPCAAQSSSDKATAEALFEAGRKLLQDGKYAEACPKFEASQRLDAGLGTLLYLGECYEKMGKLASAWATFREAESLARGRGEEDRAAIARQRASGLEPRLSRLQVAVASGNPADLRIKSDGNAVPRESWGIALPIDPGSHEIEASAPGKVTWTGSVNIEGEGSVTKVAIPVLEAVPSGTEDPAPVAEPVDAEPAPEPTQTESAGSGQRTLGLVVGVVGLGGLAVGSVFGLQAKSKFDDSKDRCRTDNENLCDDEGVTLREDAQDAALVSTITFGIGAAALAAGTILFLTAPSDEERVANRRVRVGAAVGPDSAAVTLGGLF